MEGNLKLRKALFSDLELFFSWVNESSVRENALKRTEIQLDDHIVWFNKAIEEKILLVLEINSVPIGQIRFEFDNDGSLILDYSIDVSYRGKGFGRKIIAMGIDFLLNSRWEGVLKAYVKPENSASNNVFSKLKFPFKGEIIVENQLVNLYEYYIYPLEEA